MLAHVLAVVATPALSLVPLPESVVAKSGTFRLGASTAIVAAPGAAQAVAYQLREYLAPTTGLPLPVLGRAGGKHIRLRIDRRTGKGPEGYRLVVSEDGVEIRAAAAAGLFYGVQTLRQLFPAETFRAGFPARTDWSIPAVEIADAPRFGWRGMHLDVGRHFMPKEFVLKFLDLLAMHKFNVFHWHLTEDQGWRIEIKKYPRLTEVGSIRKETMLGHYGDQKWDGKPHGGFYTQDDIREVVAYAQARHINVVPEIEMPGHAQAAIAAYPELGNLDKKLEVGTTWGVVENVFNVEDSTISFLQDVLTEVMDLFPSKFIHIGGDECPKTQWKASPKVQEKMKKLGLKDEHEMQSWFIRQMDTFLANKGRRLIGWDEILEGGLAPGAAVMSWRGEDGGIAAARSGHDVVMAPTDKTYFDYYQSRDTAKEPLAIGGFVPLQTVYDYEPIPDELTAAEAKHVLGAQGQLWTEYIPHGKQVEYMAFPRACALAEVLWSPKAPRDYSAFLARLSPHLARLKSADVNFRPLDK